MKLENRIAIVTAAGRGIGRGIALCLAEEGASVIVNSYSEETTKSTTDEIIAGGGKAYGVAGDITTPKVITKVIDYAISTHGRIDILVNNVGGYSKTPEEPGDDHLNEVMANWDSTYKQNLRPTVQMCEAVAPHMVEKKYGKIVNISSVAAKPGFPIADAYGSMKAGVMRYTQGLADRLGPDNINVNCICPGIIYTDLWRAAAENRVKTDSELEDIDAREWFLGIFSGKYQFGSGNLPTPLRREQTVEDIGRAVVFLASDDAVNITGQSFNVDGGMIKS